MARIWTFQPSASLGKTWTAFWKSACLAYFWHKALPSYRRIPSSSKSEEISALEEYKKELEDEKASIEEELREVEKRLEELKKEKLNDCQT